MSRGRGTLEVKPCDNPFFQTTAANIGAIAGQRQWVAPESYKPKKLQKDTRYDFNFMYRKESDQYGKGIGYSDSALSETVRNTESKGVIARKKGEGLYPMAPPAPAAEPVEPVTKLNRPLPNYQTKSKVEHPMYTTTNNQFGFKNPDRSTMTVDRVFIPQEFSNSFNNIKYRDQGLNTALAKSKIHTQLDPHFL
mmetsp:Transcript_10818/g.18999  ORF Transcript_10818/g.18999 Transcript_10818/m.18999 type:complete len:194 (-) Transcript_10818:62-643(-)|eukprot:CAMPEP_0205922298 /NCGR_PEP_ID=MMETSP1325-20131115/14239_1 /ASSEMBLY_ACC=CAM_ASM_000708 /TAXON_ID=236786 /ORGANISM="Florenciella sp., Strain RCC1007" /LENGTH=193 /DNA_ID=CAMNT_0053290287 /DNA_START=115 /DNA_END=696 /DNA_ORIENTATION=+